MKKQCFAALLAVFCALGCVHAQQIPDVKVRNQNGDVVQTRSLADGRTPVIVSFWSTTCKPCIKELDAIAEPDGGLARRGAVPRGGRIGR